MLTRIAVTLLLMLLSAGQVTARTLPETLLRLGEASSGDRALAAELARGYLQSRGGENLTVSSRSGELWVSARLDGSPVQIGIGGAQTDDPVRALIDGEFDLLLTANRIGQAQRKLLSSGTLSSGKRAQTENILGLQAVALAVHPHNPIRSISEIQLHTLLQGKGNWQQLGGADAPVTLLASDQLTASVLQAVLGGISVNAERVDESALVRKLKYNPTALALVPASEAEHYQTLAVTVAGISLAPKPAVIASEDYPLAQRLYLYAGGGTQNPHRSAFVDFALGNAGQAMVAQNGLTSLTPRALDAEPRGDLPTSYRELIAQGERLSISFRFDDGGIELDARAQRDIERLQRYLQQPEQREKKIALVGFSDNQRRESMARTISRFRAVRVQQALRQVNLAADRLLALGSGSPLTQDEHTAEQRNSRVEVWLF